MTTARECQQLRLTRNAGPIFGPGPRKSFYTGQSFNVHSDETYVLRCLRAGARGYVLKESAEHELIAAIRAVAAGQSFFSPKVKRLLQQEHVERMRREGGEDSYELLTEREREIMQLLAEGNSNKEIASRLHLSVYTVETHRKRILEKIDLHGTADLILYAVRKEG